MHERFEAGAKRNASRPKLSRRVEEGGNENAGIGFRPRNGAWKLATKQPSTLKQTTLDVGQKLQPITDPSAHESDRLDWSLTILPLTRRCTIPSSWSKETDPGNAPKTFALNLSAKITCLSAINPTTAVTEVRVASK